MNNDVYDVDRPSAVVVRNPLARRGSRRDVVEAVLSELTDRYTTTEVELEFSGAWEDELAHAIDEGNRFFIAIGGDGTVNAVVDALVRKRGEVPLDELTFGAVALGSSNDFHKPTEDRDCVAGSPARIDYDRAVPRDIGRAVWVDTEGVKHENAFVVSASMGATATANDFFNHGDGLVRLLKPRVVSLAIVYAAIRTLARYRNVTADIAFPDGNVVAYEISNLSVMKTPHLSGSFTYDTPIDPASGELGVNLCYGMGRFELLRILGALARGHFSGRPHTEHWMMRCVTVSPSGPQPLELDGEVHLCRQVVMDVYPEQLNVCP